MADTLQSVRLSENEYKSVTELVGITQGTAISIQNQSYEPAMVVISATKPNDNFVGVVVPIDPAFPANISAGENQVWLKGQGIVNIQEQ